MTLFQAIIAFISRNSLSWIRLVIGAGLLYLAWSLIDYVEHLVPSWAVGMQIWCFIIILGCTVIGGMGVVTGAIRLFKIEP